MSLEPCAECGHPISAAAKACPSCGAPNMPAVYKARRTAAGLVLSVVTILAFIGFFIQR